MGPFSLSYIAACLLLFHTALAHPVNPAHHAKRDGLHWVSVWTAMPQLTEPANLPPVPYNGTSSIFSNSTIRQTIRLTQPASTVRLRLSNAFGVTDLNVTKVAVSLTSDQQLGTSAIVQGSTRDILFSGNHDIIIPSGALAVSDPIAIHSQSQSSEGATLTVDVYLENGQTGGAITSHPGSRTTSWMSDGNWVGAANMTDSSVTSVDHWYFISAVEALLPSTSTSCVVIGDSLTDGRGSDTNKNNRWPDLLQSRLRNSKSKSKASISLLNLAAGGNRVLADGLGPSVLARIDRDVLAQSSVSSVVIFEGVNDIGTAGTDPQTQKAIGDRLLVAYQQVVARIHASLPDTPVIGATITPFSEPDGSNVQPYSDPEREKTRQRVNRWIRESGVFDEVVDFDAVVRDPKTPSRLAERFNSGDWLHMNVKGYQALADAFPLGFLG